MVRVKQRFAGPTLPDVHAAVHDGHRGRNRTFFSNRGLALAGGTQVVGMGQTLADDRRLERDDWFAAGQRVRNLGRDGEEVAQRGRAPMVVTAVAATSTACCAASIGVAPRK